MNQLYDITSNQHIYKCRYEYIKPTIIVFTARQPDRDCE